jgi:uncharacterized protein VcgC/VcgE DUF2780
MRPPRWLQRMAAALVVVSAVGGVPGAAAVQQDAASSAASAAAKASPELVGALSKELAATPEQAAGAAGALFGVAKTRLNPSDFSQVSNAVPGMPLLLQAAPSAGAAGTSGVASLAKSAGGLAAAASAFSKLGLKPELVAKAIPVLTSFVTKSGGANVGSLLAGVLK